MEIIKKYVERIDEELEDAKNYAEKYVEHKVKNDMDKATKYKELSNDELKHAAFIHGLVVEEIEKIKKVVTPPAEMLEKFEKAHREYVDHVAWIKQMLAM